MRFGILEAVLRVGRFKREDLIIGDRRIEGNIFTQVDEAEEAIKNFMNVRYDITGESMIRKNVWDYPVEAIREMLNNAVVRRDYFNHGTQTQIKIFDGHIRAFNPGNLMDDLTIEKLQGPHVSIARNPLLAHIFYLAGRIEQYGSGMERIRNAIAAQGQPPQTIETLGYGFVLNMKEPAAGKGKESSGEKQGKSSEKSSEKILALIKANPTIAAKNIAETIGISPRAVEKTIAKLKKEKQLRRVGPYKGGHWEVVG
jgi:ATP-dependent DNA helicase RecG